MPTEKAREDTMAVESVGRGNIVPIETLRLKRAAREQSEEAARRALDSGMGNGANPVHGPAAGDQPAAEARPRSAEERARLIDRFKSETADLPEVRRDKVIEAKVRISTGYYNRAEIRREVLHSILASLVSPPPPVDLPPAAPAG
jgi:hypothetical protein